MTRAGRPRDEIPGHTQVERVAIKFGGYQELQEALAKVGLKRTIQNIRKWNYPHDEKTGQGCGGLFPVGVLPSVLRAAIKEGIVLTDRDLSPKRTEEKEK